MSEPTIFSIRPHRGGWQCFEAPGVQPYYTGPCAKEHSIVYAKGRVAHRFGEIRIFNAGGELEQSIPFDDRQRKL